MSDLDAILHLVEILGTAAIAAWNSDQGRRLRNCEERQAIMRVTGSVQPEEKGDKELAERGKKDEQQ